MSIPTRASVESLVYEHAEAAGRAPLLDADSALRAEIERLKAALVAAAEHHEQEADDERRAPKSIRAHWLANYHEERARVLRAAAEGKSPLWTQAEIDEIRAKGARMAAEFGAAAEDGA